MQTDRPLDIVVVGEANVDLLVHDAPRLELGKEKLAPAMDLTLGGSSSITAFNLARLGTRVGFVGVVGRDLFGRFVEERLRSAGVDLKHVLRPANLKTGVTIWHLRGTRRAGVTYTGTIAALKASDVPASYLARARHLHVGAYFLLHALHPAAPSLFRGARRLGLTTSLDCNYDPVETWDSGIRRVLRQTDVFFPNEDEARRITGTSRVSSAAEALARLARIVVVKRGAKGVLVRSGESCFEMPAVRVRPVDATGAGDSFNAGFLASFVRGVSLEQCARAGVEAGARAVTCVGGTAAFE